ncbi:MAG: hypothetical protein QM733_04375 [Ilumatobacteraceae bacterium]
MSDLIPPGHQAVLFVSAARRDEYTVVDHLGAQRLTTGALGVAFAVAQRLAVDHGRAWIRCVDGSTARIDSTGEITTDTPRPWIDTLSHSHGGTHR